MPPLIAANLKMNTLPAGWNAADSPYRSKSDAEVIVFPSLLDIDRCVAAKLVTGAQYGYPASKSPRTGDVSMEMLKAYGCGYVLCGHSERRLHHHESNEEVAAMTIAALDTGLVPLVCIGETADEREMGETEEIIEAQITLLPKDPRIIIAYEPRWAIGNGKSAHPEDVTTVHAFIRSLLPDPSTKILYGGSVDSANAESLLSQPSVDGALIGGASLKLDEFSKIVEVAGRVFASKQ